MSKHHPDLVLCRKQPGIAIGKLCDKCDDKCPLCDSFVNPSKLVHICDECNYGSSQGKCIVCGGKGISNAYYCRECVALEKDRDGCPKVVNLGSARTDLFYERKKFTTPYHKYDRELFPVESFRELKFGGEQGQRSRMNQESRRDNDISSSLQDSSLAAIMFGISTTPNNPELLHEFYYFQFQHSAQADRDDDGDGDDNEDMQANTPSIPITQLLAERDMSIKAAVYHTLTMEFPKVVADTCTMHSPA
ncbi:hypothetical protein EV182_001362 [Spiromyces aspiralis]|uniref:Uncharacterized protein n=1 Tax=Spiromyces aspiralis TaxID=68401 RepID=A0ACC1HH96_9FUNG|nr:hypothetical protein EV182_001362 [Spiromyces aspiralis]